MSLIFEQWEAKFFRQPIRLLESNTRTFDCDRSESGLCRAPGSRDGGILAAGVDHNAEQPADDRE